MSNARYSLNARYARGTKWGTNCSFTVPLRHFRFEFFDLGLKLFNLLVAHGPTFLLSVPLALVLKFLGNFRKS
jgi:hypothetical protein